jgi:cytochrome c-type biogenesis protein CcmH/NrfG
MSTDTSTLKGWRSVQVYTLSAICLVVGITMGYLVRGSTAGKAPSTPAATISNPAAGIPVGSGQPSSADMKRMAEKQVAPLLEQLKSRPNDPELLAKIANFYMLGDQYAESAQYYEKLVAIKPAPEYYTALGTAHFYTNQPDKALDDMNKALQIDPKYADALYNIGMIKWRVQGDSKGAIAAWEKLIETNPKHPQLEQVKKMIAQAKKHESMPAGAKTEKPAM